MALEWRRWVESWARRKGGRGSGRCSARGRGMGGWEEDLLVGSLVGGGGIDCSGSVVVSVREGEAFVLCVMLLAGEQECGWGFRECCAEMVLQWRQISLRSISRSGYFRQPYDETVRARAFSNSSRLMCIPIKLSFPYSQPLVNAQHSPVFDQMSTVSPTICHAMVGNSNSALSTTLPISRQND